MKILVTGAAGFIGSHLVDEFLEKNWEVVGVDDLSNGNFEYLKRTEHIVGDFAADCVLDRVSSGEFDVVCHQAALPRVAYSVAEPIKTNDANLTKTLSLLDACRSTKPRFLFASSSSVYGDVRAEDLPLAELQRKMPKSPYALQKSTVEDYCRLYSELYGLQTICLRYFNVFGPRQKGNSPYATVVAAWLDALMADRPLRFDGDGEQGRDHCHIDNVKKANSLAVVENDLPDRHSVFNIACGEMVTNNEILRRIMSLAGARGIKVVGAPGRPGDIKFTKADISRAHAWLRYDPVVRFWDAFDKMCKVALGNTGDR